MSTYTIRWVLTHDPIALFEDAARHFAQMIHEESGGELEVRVQTPTEYGNGVHVSPAEVMRRVVAGELEMSQTYSTILGQLASRLWALDLPFLFENHEHAAQVLDGPIGMELLEGLVPSNLRGLAFTYSGGYRIISATEREIHRLEDIAGLNVRTSFNPVVQALYRSLGATPHPAPLQAIPELTQAGAIDAAESTWPRYWDMGHHDVQAIVNQTSHSLFLTTLVVNEVFYQGLPGHLQEVLRCCALETARQERAKSVADAITARTTYLAQGGAVVTPSFEEKVRFEQAVDGIYARFEPEFGEDLIARIRNHAARTVA